MKPLLLLLSILFFSLYTFAQTKYYVYFKDKGVTSSTRLEKSSPLFELAEKELSPKSIERRKVAMGDDNYITYEDIPLNVDYVGKIKALGIKIENQLKWFNAVTSYLTDEQIEKLKNIPSVSKIERVRIFKEKRDVSDKVITPHTLGVVSKSVLSLDYGPSFTQANLSEIPVVHDLGIAGKNVLIGLLDTGFRWKTHASLQNTKVIAERDFIQKDDVTANQPGDATDQDSHGTSVLSIIGGFASGYLIGPAYEANYLLAKTEYVPTETHIEEDNYAAALEWMEGLGVDITSSSLGYSEFDAPEFSYTYADMNGNTTIVAKAANLAFDRGVSTFTSAGNERGNSWGKIISPADAFNMIAVGSVTPTNFISSFSSPGPSYDGRIKPEICAMGSSVYRALASGSYSTGSGTSFAAPIAAGVAAILKSAFSHLNNRQIRKIFLECGDNSSNPDNDRGYGLISARNAVSFPNLSQLNGQFILHKIFINALGINQSAIRLNYKIGNTSFQTVSMNYDGILKYNYSLPTSTNGDQFEFNFTYQTNSSTSVREPANGNYKFSYGSLNVSNLTSVESKDEIPSDFYLAQNYPNPFNPSTVIIYQLPVASKVTLKVYDLLGREIATLVNEIKEAGIHHSIFSTLHYPLTSGVYFYRLDTDNFKATKKMILVR